MRVFPAFISVSLVAAVLAGGVGAAARAAAPAAQAAPPSGSSSQAAKPDAYAEFVKGATEQHGLLTVWRKKGEVYLEIAPSQLGKDFIETAIPANGLGGFGIFPGYVYLAPARIMRFTKRDDKIVITWPNTIYDAKPGSAAERAAATTYSQSVVALAPIAAEKTSNGDIIFDAKPFLGDVSAVAATLRESLGTKNPLHAYHLDPARTFFGKTEAFPDNVVVEADQTFASADPNVIDNVPDPHSVQLKVDYNIAVAPNTADYRPRPADSRVGMWDIARLEYGNYVERENRKHVVIRWNMEPGDSGKKLSPAKHPLVYYLSNTIPPEYRKTVREALLTWNDAFEKIGISNAVEVREQPNDPNWSPDDIRYNVVRWVTGSNVEFGAEAEVSFDPRTGQEINVGVLLDGNDLRFVNYLHDFEVKPLRSGKRAPTAEPPSYGAEMRAQGAFAMDAFSAMDVHQDPAFAQRFREEALRAIVLHESGHDFGLSHNFIGSYAYTAKDLQSKTFTEKYGVATSVMEYAPVNLWPKGTAQGEYFQSVLGPYDYHVIAYGYTPLDGKGAAQEKTALNAIADQWANPLDRFAGDEDTDYADAHAVDPRVNIEDLTDDPLSWCGVQLKMAHGLISSLDRREPREGQSYEVARQAFGTILGHERFCLEIPEHYIGGAYLSRSHKGDPGAAVPFQPVPRALEKRAFGMLDTYLLSDRAWSFSPKLLDTLTYNEWASWTDTSWGYDPPARHDVPVAQIAAEYQERVVGMMFQPLMLQRLDQITLNAAPGATMNLADLFNWMQRSVYGDLSSRGLRSIGLVHRNLQQRYTRRLIALALTPGPGVPSDAVALARMELTSLRSDLRSALAGHALDEMTRAHLMDLSSMVSDALQARTVVPASAPGGGDGE